MEILVFGRALGRVPLNGLVVFWRLNMGKEDRFTGTIRIGHLDRPAPGALSCNQTTVSMVRHTLRE
jgi:hypothetical protein